ncbi:hypothetical protein [Hymenobacter mucosus]|uniref:Uncharacterized protein n=1 Tax=Hymenobacter mucosus TaxID=1411120 RepID=A0A238V4Y1_9BACT|nr:hypothetical protein [Hymenobacter mucosus]SNR29552.1 hypothetical protein SAMN06269173_101158 [Hymenobacter mucosus]
MQTLLLDESSALGLVNVIVGFIVMFLVTLITLAVVFLGKWMVRRGPAAPGSNRRLLLLVLAILAFIFFILSMSTKEIEWGSVLGL